MNNYVSLTDNEYTSKWGLTDLYPEAEEKLRELLASGEDFITDWCGCKKEIRYAQYEAAGDLLTITVHAHMDDLYDSTDLLYDAAWAAGIPEDWEIEDAFITAIHEVCADDGLDDYAEAIAVLPRTASYEEVMSATGDMEDEAEATNEETFNRLKEIVKDYYDYWKFNEEG